MKKTDQEDNCCKMMELPSDDEVKALDAMRSIKEKVRYLKKQLSGMNVASGESDSEKRSLLEREMKKLKTEWNDWEQKRKEAERVRMIVLGHEEGPL
ncbi:hypothetical protein ACFL9T_06595 [Thermodesulfobacteriota bacterium]